MGTTIVCPSGLSGEIRGLKGKEGKLLADRVAARTGSTFEKIRSHRWRSSASTTPGWAHHASRRSPAVTAPVVAALLNRSFSFFTCSARRCC